MHLIKIILCFAQRLQSCKHYGLDEGNAGKPVLKAHKKNEHGNQTLEFQGQRNHYKHPAIYRNWIKAYLLETYLNSFYKLQAMVSPAAPLESSFLVIVITRKLNLISRLNLSNFNFHSLDPVMPLFMRLKSPYYQIPFPCTSTYMQAENAPNP